MSVEKYIRQPLASGHCAFPSTHDASHQPIEPSVSHNRCIGYNRANPAGEFQPCPCICHFTDCEVFECGGCGEPIKEAPHWPLDGDGDMRYTHFDQTTGRATGEEC